MIVPRLVPALVACLVFAGAWGTPQAPRRVFNVIGYYADWTAERYPLAGIPAAKLTHVNYAFGKIGPDNRLTWNAAAAVDQAYLGTAAIPAESKEPRTAGPRKDAARYMA